MLFRRLVAAVPLAGIAFVIAACGSGGDGKVTFNDDMDRVSYSIGYQIGTQISENMQAQQIDMNSEMLSRAIKDALSNAEPALSDSQMADVMQKYQEEQEAAYLADIQNNRSDASAFLSQNATSEGVVTLGDSLQYMVMEEGSGEIPSSDDVVRVHYTGQLLDGTVFDSSIERGEAVDFPVTGVIPGWSEALQMMQVGDKWKLWIPPQLAYGERGMGNRIPPNSLLIFEVELLEIVDQDDSGQ